MAVHVDAAGARRHLAGIFDVDRPVAYGHGSWRGKRRNGGADAPDRAEVSGDLNRKGGCHIGNFRRVNGDTARHEGDIEYRTHFHISLVDCEGND